MKKIDVILADDKARYRTAIRKMLEAPFLSVIGEAANGKELLTLLRRKIPDIILLDLEMPVMDGNQTFDLVRKAYPDVKVIILSAYSEYTLIEHYLERGAKGYITKDAIEETLIREAVVQVSKGNLFFKEMGDDAKTFTARQKEIMPLIFEGLTNKEIASEVSMTERGVEKQRTKIYLQAGTEKAMDFYKYAFTKGLQFLGRR